MKKIKFKHDRIGFTIHFKPIFLSFFAMFLLLCVTSKTMACTDPPQLPPNVCIETCVGPQQLIYLRIKGYNTFGAGPTDFCACGLDLPSSFGTIVNAGIVYTGTNTSVLGWNFSPNPGATFSDGGSWQGFSSAVSENIPAGQGIDLLFCIESCGPDGGCCEQTASELAGYLSNGGNVIGTGGADSNSVPDHHIAVLPAGEINISFPTCSDNVLNGDETGVDCGGTTCPPCSASCNDGIMNGDETGVDCGGTACPPCVVSIPGCTDPAAPNYNPNATVDDGSCMFPVLHAEGQAFIEGNIQITGNYDADTGEPLSPAIIHVGSPFWPGCWGRHWWYCRPHFWPWFHRRYHWFRLFNVKFDDANGNWQPIEAEYDSWIDGPTIAPAGSGGSSYAVNYIPAGGDSSSLVSRLHINDQGFVGIGTAEPSAKLHVVGDVFTTGQIISPSDARFKKDIFPMKNNLEKIERLNGVNYNYRTDEFGDYKFDDGQQIGFLAQELQEVFPELVSENKDGYLAVNYQSLIPVLVEGIKELNEKNKGLSTELLQMKDRLQAIETVLLNSEKE